ncbi:hypothetical protein DFP72DRAFT_426008 [Ephemerocybe angulata]|uniref:F-box domain-containing protein n=1 Tax=Ephemerocybe angulata TaxID=980116 RepID=A0A8H6HWR1_9AGAR|nr:hypothetical protein DFP72DRAFT_426008 [Tulosesus angulatus]
MSPTSNTSELDPDASIPLTSQKTQETIQETPSTQVSNTETNSEADTGSQRLKITASNGLTALKKLVVTEPKKKRVKRDKSFGQGSNEVSGSSVKPIKRTGSHGKLAMLPSLPLDILFEIFGHLSPADILHLSRTTKSFRRVLLNKSAISVWKAAFGNLQEDEAPTPCPEELSLPVWANLLFSPHCHSCSASNIRSIEWTLRMRLCGKCTKAQSIPQKKFKKEVKLDIILLRCLPFQRRVKDGKTNTYCLKSHREAFLKELDNLVGDRNKFIADRTSEMKTRAEHAKVCEAWSDRLAEERESALEDIRDERRYFITERLYELGYAPELKFLDDVHFTKRNLVAPLDYDLEMLTDLEEVRVAKPITERIWNGRVKDKVVDFMEIVKYFREKNDRKLLMQRRREEVAKAWPVWLAGQAQRYPPGYFLPTVRDIAEHPILKAQIEKDGEAALSQPDILGVLDTIHDAIETWRKEKSALLSSLVPEASRTDLIGDLNPAENLEWMARAMAVFNCDKRLEEYPAGPSIVYNPDKPYEEYLTYRQGQPARSYGEPTCMWFPTYLHHPSSRLAYPDWWESRYHVNEFFKVEGMPIEGEAGNEKLRRAKWNCDQLGFDEKASGLVKRILEACGMPVTATVKELDAADPRLVCLKCTYGKKCDGERRVSVLTWRRAVKHALKSHWGSNTSRFERISDSDAQKARELEAAEYRTRHGTYPPKVGETSIPHLWCLMCRDGRHEPMKPLSPIEMRWHFIRDHRASLKEFDDPQPDSLLTTMEVWDKPPTQPILIQMVPKKGRPTTKQ